MGYVVPKTAQRTQPKHGNLNQDPEPELELKTRHSATNSAG